MSLNRYEQLLIDYLESCQEEKRYWEERVMDVFCRGGRRELQALELNGQLWEYFEERSRFESLFSNALGNVGNRKVSMLNLAEHLLRMWTPVPRNAPASRRVSLGGGDVLSD